MNNNRCVVCSEVIPEGKQVCEACRDEKRSLGGSSKMKKKKVAWRWDFGVYDPFCPYCDEIAYKEDHCIFCGKNYVWVEGEIKPTVVEHNGYTIVQATNNHIQIYKDDQIILHASCTKKMTEEELKQQVDLIKKIRE